MSTSELKKKLITRISNTDNPDLLKEVFRLLDLETRDPEIYKLTDEQRKAIKAGQEDIKNGKSLTNEQANNEIDEWLKM